MTSTDWLNLAACILSLVALAFCALTVRHNRRTRRATARTEAALREIQACKQQPRGR
ncbi:hypothetical protein AAG656_28635 [Streptomyces albidoflavus]|uniref:hypothetical protein n=1 Tax=Streptomyces albidoflavus TaxID=1886 RepID=UPI00315AEF02